LHFAQFRHLTTIVLQHKARIHRCIYPTVTLVEAFYSRTNRACGTAMSTFSFLWKWRPPKCCCSNPNKCSDRRCDSSAVAVVSPGTARPSPVLFGPLRKQAGPRLLFSNKEMEIAVREWLRKTKPSVQPDENVQLVLIWDKWNNFLKDYDEK